MPLRDHFHPPLADEVGWESLHGSWPTYLVQALNRHLLTDRYRAVPFVRLGSSFEVDVVGFDRDPGVAAAAPGNGVATAVWAPPRPAAACDAGFVGSDVFEVLVRDTRRGRLVAAVEFVSPANKDRPATRRAFAAKCASFLQANVSVVVIDVVTDRHDSLHAELLDLTGLALAAPDPGPLYAVAYRTTKGASGWRVEVWPDALEVGAALPATVPLWLADDLAVPLDLEATYEEVCDVLRIR